MSKIITIIGQKETGKTTLFRQIIKKYSSNNSEKNAPLVNYVEEYIKIKENDYKLVDTPHFILSPQNEIEKEIKKQLGELIKKSDLVLWVIDMITQDTLLLNQYLKRTKIPRILLFNKIDLINFEEDLVSYQNLQISHHLFISTLKEINLDNLIEKIISLSPSLNEHEEKKINGDKKLNLLIFGAPNSGKSTLMNYLLKEDRSLVTSIAGTTQEPVISSWKWKQINFQLVDTAGITKEKKIKIDLWKKCDLAWAVIDASLPLTKQILQIINLGEKYNKALIIIINKCDLIEDKKSLREELKNRLKSLSYVPIIYLSALKGKGINLLVKSLGEMIKQSQKNFTRKEIEEITEKMLNNNQPKYYQGGKLKIYFAKHELGLVHYFIFFINNPRWVHFSYQRYMNNYLRKHLKLETLPIKLFLKKSS
jgi:GTPase